MGRKRRDSTSSEEESDESEDYSDESYSDDSDSDDSEYDSEEESEESSESDDDDDYEQLLDVLTRAGLKNVAKKLIQKKIYTVPKARDLSTNTLVKKYRIKEADAKTMKKLLNDPTALVPPESSDSESSEGSSESEDEDELVWRVLRSIDETALIKTFKKHKITTLKAAYKVNDRKLRRMGVDSKESRERIIREFEKKKDNKTSSDEDDEVKLAKLLKAIDMKPYIKNLQKGKITDMEAAYGLTSSILKSLGITAKRDRKKILAAIAAYKTSHAEDDPGLAMMKRALTKMGLKKYYTKLKAQDVDSIAELKKVDHNELREMGVQNYKERKQILDKIEKINENGTVDREEMSDAEVESDVDPDNPVNEILRAQYMSRHIADFKKANINDLKEARKLTHTQLRAMGVALYLDREKLINAFKDYRPKNAAIMDILTENNLNKYASEFEKLVDVDEAKQLTHADLRAMGLNLYGQRDRLIKAFASYEANKDDDGSSSSSGKHSKKSRSKKKKRR